MRSNIRILILRTLVLGASILALPPITVLAQAPVSTLKDNNRALLIFARESTDPSYARQQHLLENQASELADRDLIFIPVLYKRMPTDANQASPVFASDTEQKHLRSRYNIQPQEFAVLLLGKDGGEKLRSRTPVTMEKLSHLIDSMPMRQQEIRQRTRSKETRE
ncbi:DUF4174 domain-containing protein [soil metagenome]